ncbi:UvrD-helicase domain-containing protein [Xanthobacter sp. V7C-4]|uniref:UvrD-helicase domain-containing protein n=1 Tax=Xanthobacter autotrophicus (strain ATCC BAA-1158 / Py2) TaxID=78245 RepID=UPI003728F5AB
MTPEFRIVPAGAGAGKTHHIKTALLDWVEHGLVRPERILAVTFTEDGAGELRQRIRAGLVNAGQMDGALAVDRAYVSTIHSLGLRILTEHAFAAGASPAPRLLSDAERDLLIRQELAHAGALDEIARDLPRYGYGGYDRTAEDAFRARVLDMVALLANLGPRRRDSRLLEEAEEALRATYGPVARDPGRLAYALHSAVRTLLKAFPDSLAGTAMSASAREAFRSDHRALNDACDRARLDSDWTLWARLMHLRCSVRGSPTPDGYDERAGAVMAAAVAITSHPRPLEDACRHLRALADGAGQILERYAARKRALGVIDFCDMVVDAARLLREDPRVRTAVLDEIDCVIVDEFQDTNSVQFDLVWSLAKAAPRAILVGDVKQAIMGFQGADARLMGGLAAGFADAVHPLDRNWRSDPRIMAFVNAVGKGLFPGAYDSLAPTREPGRGTALEAVVTPAPRKGRSTVRPQHHFAVHIAGMLKRKDARVTDRHTGALRKLRPSDIAVLCPTNNQCAVYAEALRDLGLPVRVNDDGWWTSPIVQAACHALQLADAPDDLHAALCFLTLGPPRVSLDAALRQVLDTRTLTHPDLDAVRALSATAPLRTVRALLAEVIAAARLRDFADVQDNPAEARADLLRLEAEAGDFLATHRDMRAAAGFHGFGVKVFLGWLAARQSERGFDQHPNPAGASADGIEVLTWHSSKGREWPVVAVAGLDHAFAPRAGALTTTCADFSDLDALLGHTSLHFSPGFAAPEATQRFLDVDGPDAEATARRLTYVALTRARDVLVLEWPFSAVKKALEQEEGPHFSAAALLAVDCGMTMKDNGIRLGEVEFAALTSFCTKELPDAFASDHGLAPMALPRLGRRAVTPRPMRADGGAGHVTPSRLAIPILAPPPSVTTDILGASASSIVAPASGTWACAADRGEALHDALRVLLTRPEMAPRTAARLGLAPVDLAALAVQADALKRWLAGRGYDHIMTEVPVETRLAGGETLAATFDLVASGPAGLALVDHKSDAERDFAAGFLRHWPQLSAYVAALHALEPGAGSILVAIHWMGTGAMTSGSV